MFIGVLEILVPIAVICPFISSYVFRLVLHPLRFATCYLATINREWQFIYITYLSISLAFVMRCVTILFLATYIIGLVRHLRSRSGGDDVIRKNEIGIIPRFTLSDLMVMVFSVAFAPVLASLLSDALNGV